MAARIAAAERPYAPDMEETLARLMPPPAHRLDPFERLERANQHGGWTALGLRHRIHQIVQSVVEVDVRAPGRTIERSGARRAARRRVTRGIGFADVRLRLDDDAGRSAAANLVHEHFTNEISQHFQCRARVKGRLNLVTW